MHYKISATHLSKNDNVFFKSMLQLIQIQLNDTWSYEETADIVLADIETPLGVAFWEESTQQQDKLVIAYARQNTCNAEWFLPKPIRVQALIKQLNAIATFKSTVQGAVQTSQTSENSPSSISTTKANLLGNIPNNTAQQVKPSDIPTNKPVSIEYFEPEHSLLGLIQSTIKKCETKCFTCEQGETIYISPQQKRCFTSKINFNHLTQKQRRLYASVAAQVTMTNLSEDALHQMAKAQGLENYAVETLLWLVTLCASQGRLMAGVAENSYVRLKQWPNFAVLPCQPVHLRIAAFMLKNATTLTTVSEKTRVDFSTLVDFFNACKVADLIVETTDQNVSTEAKPKSSAEQYLFKNILKRLSSHE